MGYQVAEHRSYLFKACANLPEGILETVRIFAEQGINQFTYAPQHIKYAVKYRLDILPNDAQPGCYLFPRAKYGPEVGQR